MGPVPLITIIMCNVAEWKRPLFRYVMFIRYTAYTIHTAQYCILLYMYVPLSRPRPPSLSTLWMDVRSCVSKTSTRLFSLCASRTAPVMDMQLPRCMAFSIQFSRYFFVGRSTVLTLWYHIHMYIQYTVYV